MGTWYGRSSTGQYYQFYADGAGGAHFAGAIPAPKNPQRTSQDATTGETMIFGDPARFAVSITLDDDHGGAWLFGRLCYWINGQRVGDWESGTSLRDTLRDITSIARDRGQRENCGLFHLPAETAFSRLDRTLYGGHDPASEERVETASYHDIVPTVDVFFNWKGYLIECEGQARLLYQGPQTGLREFGMDAGVFDQVIREAHAQLDAFYEREVPAGGR